MNRPQEQHPSRERLMAFMWGHLSEDDQSELANHIDRCGACCQILREIPDDPLLARLRGAAVPSRAGAPAGSIQEQAVPEELRDHPRYKIGKFLGAGGMGVVYQAEHRLMDRQVALKIIHRNLIQNPRVIERFRQEVKAAARLSHPNIVTAYDAEQAGDVHFLVMEFVDGISLERLVRKQGPLDIVHACGFIRQASKGLQHALESGMVHRDIKPMNLMLSRKGQVKILDFGLARLASESRADLPLPTGPARPGLTAIGIVIGTPDFMAPEQINDSRGVDIRADIYSLGCTLYFLLAGQVPFAEGSAHTKLFYHKYHEPRLITEFRVDLPPQLVLLIQKMMAKDPAERPATPASVVKALAPFSRPGAHTSQAAPAEIKPAAAPVPTALPARPEEVAHADGGMFLARCPFCPTRVRLPGKAKGASILCPQCGSYFTAVPVDDGTQKRG